MKRYSRKKSKDEAPTLLQDQQLERGFLCAMLNNALATSRLRAYRQFLGDDDFTDDDNRATWQWMKACGDDMQEVNMLNVYTQAAKRGRKWDMSRYVQVHGSEGDIDSMALTISMMAIKRRLSDELKTIVMDIEYNGELAPEQALSDISQVIEKASQSVRPKTIEWLNVYIQLMKDYELVANGNRTTGYSCGFKLIDAKGGFEAGELMVIGARTSNGKTAFALNCLVNIAKQGIPVGIFSLEMTNKQLATRISSILTGIKATEIKQGTLNEDDLHRFTSLDDSLPIFFDEVRSSESDTIINNIKAMNLQHGVKVVLIDYLQLMSSRERDRVHQIGSIAHRLEALSKQLEITIVLISQLRRNIDKDPCPRLEELKESGDIADAADSIYLLYRPEHHGSYYRYPHLAKDWSNVDTAGTAMLMCVKNRQGEKVGEDIIGFQAETTRFYELAYYKTLNTATAQGDKVPF